MEDNGGFDLMGNNDKGGFNLMGGNKKKKRRVTKQEENKYP